MAKFLFRAVVLLALFAHWTTTSLAQPGRLWGIAFGSAPTELLIIDRTTGNASEVTSVDLFGSGLAYDPFRQMFYAADPSTDTLWGINAKTYQLTPLITGHNFGSVAYDPFDDRIMVSETTLATTSILSINADTYDVVDLGDPNIGTIYALGYNLDFQRLYAIGTGFDGFSGDGDFVYFNNPNTDITDWTLVSELHEQNVDLVRALAYDPDSAQFFASAVNEPFRSLITINPNTGIAATVGSFNIGNDSIYGLAVVPVPEPTTAMLCLGLMLATRAGYRWKSANA